MLNKYTFGKFESSIRLSQILEEGCIKKHKRKICMFLQRYIEELYQVRLITDSRFYQTLLSDRKHYYQNLFKSILDKNLYNIVNCIIVALYRIELRRRK